MHFHGIGEIGYVVFAQEEPMSKGTPFPPNFSYEVIAPIVKFGEFIPSGIED